MTYLASLGRCTDPDHHGKKPEQLVTRVSHAKLVDMTSPFPEISSQNHNKQHSDHRIESHVSSDHIVAL